MSKAIYLAGGGARSAYQVGVLKAIEEITKQKDFPFKIISGVSAGAINGLYMATHHTSFKEGIEGLYDIWANLSCDKIFKTSNLELLKSVFRNTIGSAFHKYKMSGYLLDTSPLDTLLTNEIDFERINRNIENGIIDSCQIMTSCYDDGKTYSFFNSCNKESPQSEGNFIYKKTELKKEQLMASTSIPLFFPPKKIGHYHYGDGGLRLESPLKVSIELGATDIFVISNHRKASKRVSHPLGYNITFAQTISSMFNALFLSNLDRDISILKKINTFLSSVPNDISEKSGWKKINIAAINPSEDIGMIAANHKDNLPGLLKYLMGALGNRKQSGDLLSYTMFESDFCCELMDLGYSDGLKARKEIEEFFEN